MTVHQPQITALPVTCQKEIVQLHIDWSIDIFVLVVCGCLPGRSVHHAISPIGPSFHQELGHPIHRYHGPAHVGYCPISTEGEIRPSASNTELTVERIPRRVSGMSFTSKRNWNVSDSMHHCMPRVHSMGRESSVKSRF